MNLCMYSGLIKKEQVSGTVDLLMPPIPLVLYTWGTLYKNMKRDKKRGDRIKQPTIKEIPYLQLDISEFLLEIIYNLFHYYKWLNGTN